MSDVLTQTASLYSDASVVVSSFSPVIMYLVGLGVLSFFAYLFLSFLVGGSSAPSSAGSSGGGSGGSAPGGVGASGVGGSGGGRGKGKGKTNPRYYVEGLGMVRERRHVSKFLQNAASIDGANIGAIAEGGIQGGSRSMLNYGTFDSPDVRRSGRVRPDDSGLDRTPDELD